MPTACRQRFTARPCPCCAPTRQIPAGFTEPGDAHQDLLSRVRLRGQQYHFCSDGGSMAPDDEPEKCCPARCPCTRSTRAIRFKPAMGLPRVEGLTRWQPCWTGTHSECGLHNMDFEGSEDRSAIFAVWRGDPPPATPATTQPVTLPPTPSQEASSQRAPHRTSSPHLLSRQDVRENFPAPLL